jgi:signal peptidase I
MITGKEAWKKVAWAWDYIWNGEGALSWVLSIVVAFIIIKFLIYPLLGLVLGTGYPVVAIVSGSMEHDIAMTNGVPAICGKQFQDTDNLNYDEYWHHCGEWYEERSIDKETFRDFSFRNGMNIGDIIVLRNPGADKIKLGDVIVFIQPKNPIVEPIIHRVVNITITKKGKYVFQTKGDHNADSNNVDHPLKYLNEYEVTEDQLIGKSIARIPWFGYVKIWAYNAILFVRG